MSIVMIVASTIVAYLHCTQSWAKRWPWNKQTMIESTTSSVDNEIVAEVNLIKQKKEKEKNAGQKLFTIDFACDDKIRKNVLNCWESKLGMIKHRSNWSRLSVFFGIWKGGQTLLWGLVRTVLDEIFAWVTLKLSSNSRKVLTRFCSCDFSRANDSGQWEEDTDFALDNLEMIATLQSSFGIALNVFFNEIGCLAAANDWLLSACFNWLWMKVVDELMALDDDLRSVEDRSQM